MFVLIAASVSIFPAAATAAAASKKLLVDPGSPLAAVQSTQTVPLGFQTSAAQAVSIAEHTPQMQALHRRMHPLAVRPWVWRGMHPYWYVAFDYHGKVVANANIRPSGKVIGVWSGIQALEPYTEGGLASVLTTPLILVPASLLFMLAFFDPRRLRRIAHVDALAVLAFLASYLLLADAQLEAAVWLAYPPLIYLLLRLLKVGFGRRRPAGALAPLLSTRVLWVGLPLMLGARIVIALLGHQEIDVGYQSVFGAYRILHHLPLYWNDSNHGDTYGPITYLAYVPFELALPWTNSLNNLHAADAAAIFFDLGTVFGLFWLGRRLRPGAPGTRLGLVLGWAWAACPFTIVGLIVHTNDGLICMLGVLAMVAFARPVVSGGLLGLAAAAKLSPAALLPLLAAPRRRGLKGALACVGAFAVVLVSAVLAWLPSGGLSYVYQRTIKFQLTRPDVFSPWGLHPSLHPLQMVIEVLAIGLAAAVAFLPRRTSLVSICALAGAVTIAIQLPATHWSIYYVMWFLPFALVAFLVCPTALESEPTSDTHLQPIRFTDEREPALAVA